MLVMGGSGRARRGTTAVERLPDASHCVHHDEAERVNELLMEFFTVTRATSTA
jgi:pimeloyl-ACP methyl ester carboxylesterase